MIWGTERDSFAYVSERLSPCCVVVLRERVKREERMSGCIVEREIVCFSERERVGERGDR